jgi:predicted transcriptional regulator
VTGSITQAHCSPRRVLTMCITLEMTRLARPMDSHSATGAKLTVTQFRMLQRIPDDGLPQTALLREGRGYGIAAQIRTLRTLIPLGLVVETQAESGEARFEITDAGRRLVEADGAR